MVSNRMGRSRTTPRTAPALNALKHGLFSQEIIIESAGERLEDFEQFKKEVWHVYKPVGAMEEMLVTDIVVNAWRRRRVRQCEAIELNSRIKAQEIRDRLERMKKVEKLKGEFWGRFSALLDPTRIEGLHWDPRVQEALASTSLGMDFLISQMRGVEDQVKRNGYLSKESNARLSACGMDAFTIVS